MAEEVWGHLIVGLAVLVLGYVLGRRSEVRAAHRSTLGPYLAGLSEALHEVVASSNVLVRRIEAKESWEQWQERGEVGAEKLKQLRIEVRYPLWGLDQSLRWLTRVPGWLGHVRNDPGEAKDLVGKANTLRSYLDAIIRRSYVRGRPPTLWDRAQVRFVAWRAERKRAMLMPGPQKRAMDDET